MEKYKTEIAPYPSVVFIHVSRDTRESHAAKWTKENGFSWLTVLPVNVGRSKLMRYRTKNATPFFSLVDTSGVTIATGAEAIFQKLAELKDE